MFKKAKRVPDGMRTRPKRQRLLAGVSMIALGVFLLGGTDASPRDTLPKAMSDADFLYNGTPSEALFELGQMLFFDPILSGNRNISCGTCHDPAHGTSDGVALSIGEGGVGFGPARRTQDGVTSRIPRNAQALWNIGALEYRTMFHDGRLQIDPAKTFESGFWSPAREDLPAGLNSLLAAQAMFPVLSPSEMAGQKGENPVATAVVEDRLGDAWDLLAARLTAIPDYVALFNAAFPDAAGRAQISYVEVAEALSAFQTVAFRSDDSPFDRFLAGDILALDAEARAGLAVFFGKAGCASCHSGALLSDHEFHAIAVPQIGPGKGHGADTTYWRASGFKDRLEDEGRYRVTFENDDLFAFRTPSLRNVALTGPWGHTGAFDDLEAMVRHHLDSVASLGAYDPASVELPRLSNVIEPVGQGSTLSFPPLNPSRRDAFDLRDTWVQRSDRLRRRIADANDLPAQMLGDDDVNALLAFLESLTDPTAVDRRYLVPRSVPSGLSPQPSVLPVQAPMR